jgi:LysR family glycine cleavage system transcriptional activator
LDTDVAIDWGQGGPTEWPGLDAQRLLEVAYVPVLSPALLKERGPLKTASDLAQLPIVHQQTKDDWHAWFALNGQPAISLAQETVMADSNMAMQAAVDGHGVALGALAMVQSDLDAGRLVCPFHTPLRPGQAYFLLSHSGARKAPAVQALWDWLLAQSADAQV